MSKLPPEFYNNPENREIWLIWGCLWAWLGIPVYYVCLALDASERAAILASFVWIGLFSILPVYLKIRGNLDVSKKEPVTFMTQEQVANRIAFKLKTMSPETLAKHWVKVYPHLGLEYLGGVYEITAIATQRLKGSFVEYQTRPSGNRRALIRIIESESPQLVPGMSIAVRLESGIPDSLDPGQTFVARVVVKDRNIFFENITLV